jgi:hypothetical protein
MEALDLVKSINSEHRLERLNSVLINSLPKTLQRPEISPHPNPSVLNKVRMVNKMKKTHSDFIEPFFEKNEKPSIEDLTAVARREW